MVGLPHGSVICMRLLEDTSPAIGWKVPKFNLSRPKRWHEHVANLDRRRGTSTCWHKPLTGTILCNAEGARVDSLESEQTFSACVTGYQGRHGVLQAERS